MFRFTQFSRIQTIRILGSFFTETKNAFNTKMLNLQLIMKDGDIHHEHIEQSLAVKKYRDFFHNPNDQNFDHNQLMFRDQNVIPMHENAKATNRIS